MFNKNFRKDKHFSATGFRYRGVEGSRIEQLTDAVFAFAITLLVIAPEVPKTYVELQVSMYGFLGFIACVLLLFGIWSNHSLFFLQYGLQDRMTKAFNFLFLFVLLFYIYPLKYLFSLVGAMLLFPMVKDNSEAYRIALEKINAASLSIDQWQDLIIRFGLGLLLIYGILALMHYNALRRKEDLELNKQEIYETKFHILNYVLLMSISALSVIYIIIQGGYYAEIAGLIYLLIPVGLPFVKLAYLRRFKKKFPEAFEDDKSIESVIENKERVKVETKNQVQKVKSNSQQRKAVQTKSETVTKKRKSTKVLPKPNTAKKKTNPAQSINKKNNSNKE